MDATGFDDRTGMSPSPHGGDKFQKLLHFLLVAHEGGGSVASIMDRKDYKTDYVRAVNVLENLTSLKGLMSHVHVAPKDVYRAPCGDDFPLENAASAKNEA